MARRQPRRSLLWRLTKWCGFSSPLVIVVAIAGRFLGIDTSWFVEAETSQGKALIQAISKAAQDRDGPDPLEPPARVVRNGDRGFDASMPSKGTVRDDWRPPPPSGIAPPQPRNNVGNSPKVVDRRKNDDMSFPSPQIRR